MADAKTTSSTSTLPVETFVHCESGSRGSEAATDVARRLARRRGGTVQLVDELAVDDEHVVVVDGCGQACVTRLLDARGVHVDASLTLDKIGVTSSTAGGDIASETVDKAERLLDRGAAHSRPHRPAPPTPAPFGEARAHTIGDYLLAIDWLTSPIGPCGALVPSAPTLAAHVSVALGVSRPSAGEMLGRLEERGLVRRGEGKGLVLTDEGVHQADLEVRKHRLLERFVVDTLGYGEAESFQLARDLAPSFSDDATARLDVSLGHPQRCPHGWPVDPDAARAEAHDLIALATLAPGDSAVVVRLPEQAHDLLERLLHEGVRPGATVTIERTGADLVDISVDGGRTTLASAHASQVLVSHPG